ncbi:hypothetical protein SVIOM342S_01789 [Streptomyces violaceorubidus]
MQEAERGADPGAGQGVRVEGVQRQSLRPRVGDGGDVERHHERDLDEQQDAQHARVDVDLQPAQRADREDGQQGRDPPGHVDVGVGGQQAGDLEAEDAVDADLEGVVGTLALGGGELTLVEPLLATNLLFALALSRIQTRQPLGRQGWAGLALLAGGVTAFILAGEPRRAAR